MMHPPHHFPQAYNQKQGMPVPVPTAPENYTYSPAVTSYPPSGVMYAPPPHGRITRWSTGLCHCMDDPGNCLVTCMCPCITFGQIADIVDKGTCSCVAAGTAYGLLCIACLGCVYSCCYRSRLRAEYDLKEGPAPDFLVHCCCETCALCQEYRELKSKGFDMGIGWDANLDRQRRGATGTPAMGAPAVGQMMR